MAASQTPLAALGRWRDRIFWISFALVVVGVLLPWQSTSESGYVVGEYWDWWVHREDSDLGIATAGGLLALLGVLGIAGLRRALRARGARARNGVLIAACCVLWLVVVNGVDDSFTTATGTHVLVFSDVGNDLAAWGAVGLLLSRVLAFIVEG